MIHVVSEVQLLILRNQYDRGHSCESKGMGIFGAKIWGVTNLEFGTPLEIWNSWELFKKPKFVSAARCTL